MSEQKETFLNDQILDSIQQIQKMTDDVDISKSIAQQLTAQAVSLAMQNAVAQQQEQYILRNAIVTAAAQAILQSNPEDAIALAEKALSGSDVVETLRNLEGLMSTATQSANP